MFSRCLEKDEKKRPSAAQLLSHAFMRVPMEKCSPQRPTEDNNRGPSSPALSPEPAVADLMSRSSLSGQSRVQSEFEVMQWIGKGAFGDVIKVRLPPPPSTEHSTHQKAIIIHFYNIGFYFKKIVQKIANVIFLLIAS